VVNGKGVLLKPAGLDYTLEPSQDSQDVCRAPGDPASEEDSDAAGDVTHDTTERRSTETGIKESQGGHTRETAKGLTAADHRWWE
jgi:hypothetical protein